VKRSAAAPKVPWHTQQDVRQLFSAFADREGPLRPLRQPRRAASATLRSSRSLLCGIEQPMTREGSSSELQLGGARTAAAAAKLAISTVACASFEAVLRLYYRLASNEHIEQMLRLVERKYEERTRKLWIAEVKASSRDALREAFLTGDADGNEGLSLREFCDAVATHEGRHRTNAAEGGAAEGGAAEGEEPEGEAEAKARHGSLAAAFARADRDGSGTLDFDEFLEAVASNPRLVASFDEIIAAGCERRQIREQRSHEIRTSGIFRYAVSPGSHGVISPSGRRRRPTLGDLKRADQLLCLPM
jgi:Ca2+-binding EF-hand superfamily protein